MRFFILVRFYCKAIMPKNFLTTLVLLMGVVTIGAFVLYDINIAYAYKLYDDFFMLSISVVVHFFALIIAYEQIQKVAQTSLLVCSMGYSKKQIITALLFSGALFLLFLTLVFVLLYSSISFVLQVDYNILVVLGSLLLGFSAILLWALILLFGTFNITSYKSILYALMLFVVGNSIDELYYYVEYIDTFKGLKYLYYLLNAIAIDFSLFDTVSNQTLSWQVFAYKVGYAVVVFVVLLFLIRFKVPSMKIYA